MAEYAFSKLVVADIDRAVSYYAGVYGLEEKKRLRAELGDASIEECFVAPKDADGEWPEGALILLCFIGGAPPQSGAAILGFTTDDVEATMAKAVANGASLFAEPELVPEAGARVGYVKDPEGNLNEIVEMRGA